MSRIDLESMTAQLGPLINERRVTTLDLQCATALALLDIAESLRVLTDCNE